MPYYPDISYFVINMARDLSRWQQLQARCPAGIEFTRFDAIDGHQVVDKGRGWVQDVGRLTAPELGCLLSHVGVWQKVLDQDFPLAVVMEDDVMFGDNFGERMQVFLSMLPKDFDLAYLGFNPDMHVQFEIPGVGKVVVTVENQQYELATLETACYRLYRAWGTCSYVISRQGAARLLDLVTNTAYAEYHYFKLADGLGNTGEFGAPLSPIDIRMMSLMEQLQAYVAFPPICKPHPQLDTTIAKRAWHP